MEHLLEPLISYVPYLALLVRVCVGATLMIHGRPKLNKANRERSIKNFETKGVPPIAVLLVAILEFFGGLFLVVGFLVPLIAAFVAVDFGAIIVMKRTKENAAYVAYGKPNFELEVLFILLSIVLVVIGAGALSVDGLVGL